MASEVFKDYATRVVRDARALAAALEDEGIRIVSGGTDSHLMLADVRPVGIDGKRAEAVLDEVQIAVNKNQIPFDPNPPSAPSGLRLGTPGLCDARDGRSRRCARSGASSATSSGRPTTRGRRRRLAGASAT